jgi:hypothetical protein
LTLTLKTDEMMSQPFFQSEDLATEWASRICDRLAGIGVPEDEVSETRNIIFSFTRIAADELCQDRKLVLPHSEQPFIIDAHHAHLIIELFLRGVNHTSKKLRDTGLDWETRRTHMETLAWKLFNLAKLLVGFLNVPDPNLSGSLNTEKDLQLMMKQSADTMLRETISGTKGVMLPWSNWKP